MKNIFLCFIFVCYFFLSSCTPSETILEGDCSCGKVIEASTFQVQGNHFTSNQTKLMENDKAILTRLENLSKRKQHFNEAGYGINGMALEQHGRVVLCKDIENMRETRTHNVALYDKHLWFENGNSKGWSYHFQSLEEAAEWWNKTYPTCKLDPQTLKEI